MSSGGSESGETWSQWLVRSTGGDHNPAMANQTKSGKRGVATVVLDLIERIGNLLPDPVFLFLGAAVLVALLSAVGAGMGWSVQPLVPARGADGSMALVAQGDRIEAKSILTSEGIYWALANAVKNFINFAPLGVVLTSMLGIGLAEKVGMFGAAMKWLAALVPSVLLTPVIVFLGVMSSAASDAGYIVLPPLAAALYLAVGRSPVAGIAAAFAGIAGGFSANLLISAGDAVLSELTTRAAHVLDVQYTVVATCNWYFMIVSTFMLTIVGWGVTAWLVEPRLRAKAPDEGGPMAATAAELEAQKLTKEEKRGLWWALVGMMGVVAVVLALVLVKGWPLEGAAKLTAAAQPTPKWTHVIPPLILAAFVVPGLAYGMATGSIRGQKDVTKAFIHAMSTMAPVIVLAFFAAQFIEYLKYSNLDRMLAYIGGDALAEAGLPPLLLLVAVVVLSLFINIFIGSMSAKYTMLAPILVPMLMMVGISPELTQVSYRVGDSVTNMVTPLNTYMIVILVAVQRYAKSAGVGSIIAMMMPYSVVFTIFWTLLLVAWVWLGIPLGPRGPLEYVAPVP